MRRIYENEDLSGQTLTGPGIQAYFYNCELTDTVFVGDWTGATYINCRGPADWSAADTYASYWRGCDLTGSKFPAKIGHLHHEPVGSIIRERAELVQGWARQRVRTVANFVLSGDYATASWNTSQVLWWEGLSDRQRQELMDAFRLVFAPYPSLASRFEQLVRGLGGDEPLREVNVPLRTVVNFSDGVKVVVDALDLPSLPRPGDCYELARWIEAQPGVSETATPHCFVQSILPPVVIIMASPDDWLANRKGGL